MAERARVPLGWRVLAVALALPGALYVLGRGGEAWYLVLAAFALPGMVGRRFDARVIAVALGLSLSLPIAPVIARVFPFDLERCALHGALAVLAWRGALAPSPRSEAWVRGVRALLLAWLAWSLGGALRGLWLDIPSGAPWLSHVLYGVFERWIATTSMVASTEPLHAFFLRGETVLVAWALFELTLRDERTPREVAGALVWAVPLALLVAGVEMAQASAWRGESLVERMRGGLPRSHRPLSDHNALGSAMLLVVPVLAWSAWSELRARRRLRAALATFALVSGLALLFSSRSKSGFGGLALAAVAAGAFSAVLLPRRARRGLAWLAGLAALGIVALNLLPRPALEVLMQSRRAEDVLRLFHRRGLIGYLRDNRVAIWEAGARMGADEPVFGVGLGNFPRRLVDYRDPTARYDFNPLHENAHNQYLHWWGEEGFVGALLGLAVFALGIAGGVRYLRGPPGETASDEASGEPVGADRRLAFVPWTAALLGMLGNLVVGHALLVPTVAYLWAAWIGVCAAAGARRARGSAELASGPFGNAPSASTTAERALPKGAVPALAALALVALAPVAWTERAPLEGFATGCHPWSPLEGVPDRARLLEADARWMQRWGDGARMLLIVHDTRPLRIPGEMRLDVAVDGAWVLRGVALERSVQPLAPNPLANLKLDAPPGVGPGDLVEIRVRASQEFAGTLMFDKARALSGPRMLPPVFLDPRGREKR